MAIELSPCLDLLFCDDDLPVLLEARIRRAAETGVRWVEMWGWTQHDIRAVKEALQTTGLRLNCLTLSPFAPLVDTRAHDAFLDSVHRSCRTAANLECPFVVVLAGDQLPSQPRAVQHQAIIEGLRRGASVAEAYSVTLLLENLNSRIDHVGHYLDRTPEALDIVEAVDHPSVRMLFDLYHSVVMGERSTEVLGGRLDLVSHVQVADVPGRHEPGTGIIDWLAEVSWLSEHGYGGRLGLEYLPTKGTVPSMAHLRSVLATLDADPSPYAT